jgi:thiol-disulfide isomerase/thioredoxin
MSSFVKDLLLPDLAVTLLVANSDESAEEITTLSKLRGEEEKAMVIDFWTTKCTRCPAALEKLNDEACLAENADIVFVSCALSQGKDNYVMAADLVCDNGSFAELIHCYMDMETKETAKAIFGFASVPFYVVVDKRGVILGMGEPKAVNYRSLIDNAAVATTTSSISSCENESASVGNKITTTETVVHAPTLVFDDDF